MLDAVKRIPFFRDLNEEQLELIAPLFEIYTCPANQTIFEQNERADFLYILVNGTASIHYKPYDGARMVLTRIRPGNVFGWSSVVGGPAYRSSICSETEIEAIRIRGRDLRKLCREHPDIGSLVLNRLAEAVSGRWQDSHQQVQAILHRNIKRKSNLHSKQL